MGKESSKQDRGSLSKLEGKTVRCTGRFVHARVSNEQFITLLFKEVWVDTIYYDHLWVIHNDSFEGIDIRYNCMMEFYGVVKKYNEDSSRYGVAFCYGAKVLWHDAKTEDENFTGMQLHFKTVNYEHWMSESLPKAYIKFKDDYGFGNRDYVKLVYSPWLTMCNEKRELSFEAYDNNGRMAEFSSITFNPIRDRHKVMIDREYYVKINETLYRKLSLLYYLVTRTRRGCMAYVPKEVMGEYAIVLEGDTESYYYCLHKMFTLKEGECACIGRPDREGLPCKKAGE